MQKIFLKKLQILGLSLAIILGMNIITRVYMNFSVIPKYFMIDIFYILLALSLIFLIKSPLYSEIYAGFIVFIGVFLFVLNITYFLQSDTMFYLGLLSFLGEAQEVFDPSYINVGVIFIGFSFLFLYILIEIIIDKHWKINKNKLSSFYFPYGTLLVLTLVMLSIGGISATTGVVFEQNKNVEVTNNLQNGYQVINFYTKYLRNSSFENYGMLGMYSSEYSLIYGDEGVGDIDYVYQDSDKDDSYTGLLSGYNIITIMIETGIYDAISKEFTPNLYYLQSNGLNLSNNYSKNKTSVSEIIGFTGSYPSSGINYDYNYNSDTSIYNLQIDVPTSLPLLLKDTYITSFYHDGRGLYARNSLYNDFGFESWKHEFYDEGIHTSDEEGWNFDGSYELDSDYIDIVLDEMIPSSDEPFYTYWTTLSTHGPYLQASNYKVSERDELFKEMGYTDKFDSLYDEVYGKIYGQLESDAYNALRHLICAFMNLDEAVGKIISRVKELGKWDNTLFVVYGDHEAYYEKLSNILNEASSQEDVWKYHTTMFFYNETLTNKYREINSIKSTDNCEFSLFTSPYIIVPTTLDLLGIEYDSNLYFSPSIFKFTSMYDGLFYSNELSAFFTNQVFLGANSNIEYIESDVSEKMLKEILKIQNSRLKKILFLDQKYSLWLTYQTA